MYGFEMLLLLGLGVIVYYINAWLGKRREVEHKRRYNQDLDDMAAYKKEHGWYEHEE